MRTDLLASQLRMKNIGKGQADVMLLLDEILVAEIKDVRTIITDTEGIEIHFPKKSLTDDYIRVSPQFPQDIMDLDWEANRRTLRITKLRKRDE